MPKLGFNRILYIWDSILLALVYLVLKTFEIFQNNPEVTQTLTPKAWALVIWVVGHFEGTSELISKCPTLIIYKPSWRDLGAK